MSHGRFIMAWRAATINCFWSLTSAIACQVLMAGQGFEVSDFIWTEKSYRVYNRLAGNTVTTSVLGALVVGLTLGILLKDDSGRCLG